MYSFTTKRRCFWQSWASRRIPRAAEICLLFYKRWACLALYPLYVYLVTITMILTVIRIHWITLLKVLCCSQTTACTRLCWPRQRGKIGNVYTSWKYWARYVQCSMSSIVACTNQCTKVTEKFIAKSQEKLTHQGEKLPGINIKIDETPGERESSYTWLSVLAPASG